MEKWIADWGRDIHASGGKIEGKWNELMNKRISKWIGEWLMCRNSHDRINKKYINRFMGMNNLLELKLIKTLGHPLFAF